MAENSENLRMGDVEVYIDYADGNGEQHLGHTLGGVELTFEREFEDLLADKYGSTPIDMILTGNNLLIKVMLAEITNENISRGIPEGQFAESGSDSKLGVGTDAGFKLSTEAGLLRLHPRQNTPSNRNEDVYIWKAVSSEAVELGYKVDEQRVVEVTFRALIDETKENKNRLGRFGDVDIS